MPPCCFRTGPIFVSLAFFGTGGVGVLASVHDLTFIAAGRSPARATVMGNAVQGCVGSMCSVPTRAGGVWRIRYESVPVGVRPCRTLYHSTGFWLTVHRRDLVPTRTVAPNGALEQRLSASHRRTLLRPTFLLLEGRYRAWIDRLAHSLTDSDC